MENDEEVKAASDATDKPSDAHKKRRTAKSDKTAAKHDADASADSDDSDLPGSGDAGDSGEPVDAGTASSSDTARGEPDKKPGPEAAGQEPGQKAPTHALRFHRRTHRRR
jgi:hypothetical protein